ncbi:MULTISPECIES: ABC transporter permease [unclassified Crossiella]|uniref:ABC transporter permease n=1 Tax=unclassified Crossiella TaxID=2620835 RepID=UPI001FFE669D|nr:MULTISPECIES: ABC transporter permease [unclassified Crossiella]MCK2241021.1 ABC transporter permease [Crossiella sp. S99.2]MCK2253835.1 ABC transporter permease [Crossiella sp. S99.1]
MNPTYLFIEVKLIVRQFAFLFFTIVVPTAMFLIFSGIYGGGTATFRNGTPVTAATMVSMASFAAMSAALVTGGRIALERQIAWHRQLRLTPLSGGGYLLAKGLIAVLVAIPAMLGVLAVGVIVRQIDLSLAQWAMLIAGLVLGSVPFALLGMAIGQLASAESAQAVTPAVMMALAMVGGLMVPVEIMPDWVGDIARALPSFWFRENGIRVIAEGTVSLPAIAVLSGVTLVLGLFVARRYRLSAGR